MGYVGIVKLVKTRDLNNVMYKIGVKRFSAEKIIIGRTEIRN